MAVPVYTAGTAFLFMAYNKESSKKWYLRNKEKSKKLCMAYYRKNIKKMRAYKAKWARDNRAKGPRRWELMNDFGLTLEKYQELWQIQNGCCAICNIHQSKFTMRLAVDHCHSTNKVRGLLCKHCNQTLGLFNDDAARFRKAAEYLERVYASVD